MQEQKNYAIQRHTEPKHFSKDLLKKPTTIALLYWFFALNKYGAKI